MLLLLLAIIEWNEAIVALLLPSQTMKFFQRLGLGDSGTFMGGPEVLQLLQGLYQGNGATL